MGFWAKALKWLQKHSLSSLPLAPGQGGAWSVTSSCGKGGPLTVLALPCSPTGHTSCHRWAVEDAMTLRRPAKVLDCFHSLASRAAHRRVGWGSSPTPEAEQLWAPGLRGRMPCITGWSDLATQPRPRDRDEAAQDDVNTGTHKFVAQRERESLLLEICLCSLLGLQKDR